MLAIDIEKHLKEFQLRVAFEVGDEVVTLFGPSGSGKSLTLRCIAGLLRPDAGRVVINGRLVFDGSQALDLPPQRRRIGYLFQHYALFPHLSVEENIAYGLHALPLAERKRRVVEAVASMRLEGLERRRPGQLSGGQQQRVALARALVTQPEVLLLDEPFSALDSTIRSRLQRELLEVFSRLGITVILVTHNLDEAYIMSEKIIVYDAGQVLQIGHRDEVIRRPQTRSVARFTGAKNIFEGVVTAIGSHQLEIAGDRFGVITPLYPCVVGQQVEFCIRPEEIMLVRPGQGEGEGIKENRLSGDIVGQIAHGNRYTLFFRLASPGSAEMLDYDLQIELPRHVYQKLELAHQKAWSISLKKSAIHVIGLSDGRGEGT